MEETNKFRLGGVVELQPIIKTADSGKRYCNIQVVQTRYVGKDYETEMKRYFNIVSFDEAFIDQVFDQKQKFHCVIEGNIGINYGGKVKFGLNLVGNKIIIDEKYEQDFNVLTKKKKVVEEPKPQPSAQEVLVGLDDEDLPF